MANFSKFEQIVLVLSVTELQSRFARKLELHTFTNLIATLTKQKFAAYVKTFYQIVTVNGDMLAIKLYNKPLRLVTCMNLVFYMFAFIFVVLPPFVSKPHMLHDVNASMM